MHGTSPGKKDKVNLPLSIIKFYSLDSQYKDATFAVKSYNSERNKDPKFVFETMRKIIKEVTQ